jgi:hypothetical protein
MQRHTSHVTRHTSHVTRHREHLRGALTRYDAHLEQTPKYASPQAPARHVRGFGLMELVAAVEGKPVLHNRILRHVSAANTVTHDNSHRKPLRKPLLNALCLRGPQHGSAEADEAGAEQDEQRDDIDQAGDVAAGAWALTT